MTWDISTGGFGLPPIESLLMQNQRARHSPGETGGQATALSCLAAVVQIDLHAHIPARPSWRRDTPTASIFRYMHVIRLGTTKTTTETSPLRICHPRLPVKAHSKVG